MVFEPDYGETLLTEEEREALTAEAREILGDPIRKADLYDLEQQIQDEVADELVAEVIDGTLTTSEMLTDHFVRELHQRLYGRCGNWVVVSGPARPISASRRSASRSSCAIRSTICTTSGSTLPA